MAARISRSSWWSRARACRRTPSPASPSACCACRSPSGFAAAANLGIAARARRPRGPGQRRRGGRAGLAARRSSARCGPIPRAAAAQGVNLKLPRALTGPGVVDGWGIGWNRAWQAVQLGRDEEPPEVSAPAERGLRRLRHRGRLSPRRARGRGAAASERARRKVPAADLRAAARVLLRGRRPRRSAARRGPPRPARCRRRELGTPARRPAPCSAGASPH